MEDFSQFLNYDLEKMFRLLRTTVIRLIAESNWIFDRVVFKFWDKKHQLTNFKYLI